jgi:hypothetical protein
LFSIKAKFGDSGKKEITTDISEEKAGNDVTILNIYIERG